MSRNNDADSTEAILAEEQSVIHKTGFGKEVQGTLILTNRRLIFVVGNKEEDVVAPGIMGFTTTDRFRFADINDLSSFSNDASNLFIPLSQIELEEGHGGVFKQPSLKVKWTESGTERSAEFAADFSGGRKKNLKDWAGIIERLKSGTLIPQFPKGAKPNVDTLEWRILQVLRDMQEKGVFEIEEQVEETFKVDLEPDVIDAACQRLSTLGFLDKIPDPSGDNFYRVHSPLGEDDLSS
ncbi:MAG: hypothetical protein ACYC7D_09555 [Nitrososphaerales archaeon]